MTTAWNAVESALLTVLSWLDDIFAMSVLTRGWSWGFAVVALTLLVRAALIPAVAYQLRFNRKMADLQPEIAAIRERHGVSGEQAKAHPTGFAKGWVKSEEEQDALLKEHGIRWYAGFLPAIVQIPAVVAVLRLLATEAPDNLRSATWPFVPPAGASFLHDERGRVALGILACVVGLLVFLAQRRRLSAAPSPPSPLMRRLRLGVLPVAVTLLVLKLPATVVVSVLASLLAGWAQSVWTDSRRDRRAEAAREERTS